MIHYTAAAIGFSAIAVWLVKLLSKDKGNETDAGFSTGAGNVFKEYAGVWITIMFAAALLLRMYLGMYSEGFQGDLDTFKSWAGTVYDTGFQNVYSQDIFLDYPPGYLYVLYFAEAIRRLLSLDFYSPIFTFIIKSSSIFADIFSAAALLWLAKRRFPLSKAVFVCAAYLFCPAVIINSAVWGQADSFCAAFLLVSVFLLYKNHFVYSAAIYGAAIILKPQMLIFAPLYIFYAIRKKNYKMLVIGPLLVVGVILLLATPFTKNFNYHWILNQYIETLSSYNCYSVNAYNIFSLFNLNWVSLPEGAAGMLLNFTGPALATAVCGIFMLRSERDDALFACPVILMSVVYIFTVKMHERYLFPVLVFMLLCYIFTKDIRVIYAFAAVSAMHLLNVAYVMWINQEFGANYDPNEAAVKLMSAMQILAFIYMMYVFSDVYLRRRTVSKAKAKGVIELKGMSIIPAGVKIKPLDICMVLGITVLYGIIAFWNLGANKTAVTSWTPEQGEQVVIKADRAVDTICFIPGIAPDKENYRSITGSNVAVEISVDGEAWEYGENLSEKGAEAFTWKLYDMSAPVSYVRLTAMDDNVCLNEVGLRNAESEEYAGLNLIAGGGTALLDEQEIIPAVPDYYNSMYFDEIFHARTAYEHILGLEPYENTHPPLGKLLIALGIGIFGMNPFGWRIVGTLFGVLMLPCIYYLLKRLFGSSFLCSAGTLLLALDFMHFTQTRIATIDTYALFFTILMYTAMVVFMQADLKNGKLSRIMLPLVASGIFMGLGIAAKWTVAYGALGLCILFIIKLVSSYRQCNIEEKRNIMRKKYLKLCGYCCIWFILIPVLLYFTAFLPMTALPHNEVFASFINYQENMFKYHYDLEATHPFQSPWYEWPFIVRPIWYSYSESLFSPGMARSISSLGNPALWWAGIPAMLFAAEVIFKKRIKARAEVQGDSLIITNYVDKRQAGGRVLAGITAVVGFASAYLPWVMIPRITFIYHYFTAVPFLIVAVILMFDTLKSRWSRGISIGRMGEITWADAGLCLYLLVNAVLFIMFFPVLSGMEVPREYLQFLQWFSTWSFAAAA